MKRRWRETTRDTGVVYLKMNVGVVQAVDSNPGADSDNYCATSPRQPNDYITYAVLHTLSQQKTFPGFGP